MPLSSFHPVARSASFVGALALAVTGAGPLPPAVAAASVSPDAPLSLDTLRWQRRLIVAFGDASAEIAGLERLVDEHACRLDERDTDVLRVTADRVLPLSSGAARLDEASRDALTALRREEGDAFELVLIGKDGGVKRRARRADALPDFLDAIDGMPMRRAERRGDPDDC